MRILFDQGTPVPLRQHLTSHLVDTAFERGWSTLRNGELLEVAEHARYDLLITTDQNLRYQQHLAARQLAIIVLLSTFVAPYTTADRSYTGSGGACRARRVRRNCDLTRPSHEACPSQQGGVVSPCKWKAMCHVALRPQLKADPMSMRTFSPNPALHLTAYSVCSSVAPASGGR